MKKMNRGAIGRTALITTTLIWGSSFVILKSTLDSITPLWVLAIRFIGAAVIMLLACLPKLKELDRRYIEGGAIMGVCLAAAYTVQTYGLYYTTPGKNAFLTATYCVLVPFLYWMILGKKPDKYNISAAFICLIGMGFVCLDKDLSVNMGDIITIFCGLFYGLHIILTAKFVEGRSALLLTTVQFLFGGITLLIAAVMFEPVPVSIPSNAWWGIAYLTVMCTGVCFFLQTIGQKFTPPSAVSVILTLESVFGTIISICLGQEILRIGIFVGFCLIFSAVIISETKLEFLKKNKKPRLE